MFEGNVQNIKTHIFDGKSKAVGIVFLSFRKISVKFTHFSTSKIEKWGNSGQNPTKTHETTDFCLHVLKKSRNRSE